MKTVRVRVPHPAPALLPRAAFPSGDLGWVWGTREQLLCAGVSLSVEPCVTPVAGFSSEPVRNRGGPRCTWPSCLASDPSPAPRAPQAQRPSLAAANHVQQPAPASEGQPDEPRPNTHQHPQAEGWLCGGPGRPQLSPALAPAGVLAPWWWYLLSPLGPRVFGGDSWPHRPREGLRDAPVHVGGGAQRLRS